MGRSKGGGRFQNPRRESSLPGGGVRRWTLAIGALLSRAVARAGASLSAGKLLKM